MSNSSHTFQSWSKDIPKGMMPQSQNGPPQPSFPVNISVPPPLYQGSIPSSSILTPQVPPAQPFLCHQQQSPFNGPPPPLQHGQQILQGHSSLQPSSQHLPPPFQNNQALQLHGNCVPNASLTSTNVLTQSLHPRSDVKSNEQIPKNITVQPFNNLFPPHYIHLPPPLPTHLPPPLSGHLGQSSLSTYLPPPQLPSRLPSLSAFATTSEPMTGITPSSNFSFYQNSATGGHLPQHSPSIPSNNFSVTMGYNIPTSLNFEKEVKVESQKDVDKNWLQKWLKTRENTVLAQKISVKKSVISIPEFRDLLREMFAALRELENSKELLVSSFDADEAMWKFKLRRTLKLKEQVEEISKKLFSPSLLNSMKEKVKRLKRKRERQHRQKEELKWEKRQDEIEHEELNRKIDNKNEQAKEKAIKIKRETEMKEEADYILSEVRKKIQEAKKSLEKLKILEKLRHARKDNAVKKGLQISNESDEKFKKNISSLKILMQKQLKDYEAEEKAMRVILETEQEGQREQEAARKLEYVQRLVDNRQHEIENYLFGDGPPSPSSPLYFFWQFHTEAETNLDCLLQIRQQWDMYLVPQEDSDGSSIPQQWVTCNQLHGLWASALDET